jgi:hypothetical protein
MRVACALAALGFAAAVPAQPPLPELKGEPAAEKKEQKQQPKRGPRVSLKPKGGTGSSVGDGAAGGGARSAEASKGGTPGTPSGSFTGPPSKP